MGRQEQQYRLRQHRGGETGDPRSSSRSVLESPALPQPATVPQVQHLPGKRRSVWSIHSQRPAPLTRTGNTINVLAAQPMELVLYTL